MSQQAHVDPTIQTTGEIATQRKFSMRGKPLLANGTSFDPVATAENLWLAIKVYARGGENELHAHTVEDHAFVVLQGRATFYFADGSHCEALPFEGVMIPKGTQYRFEAAEEENLVLLRIGGAQRKTQGIDDLQSYGSPKELAGTTVMASGVEKQGRTTRISTPSYKVERIPGKFFPQDR